MGEPTTVIGLLALVSGLFFSNVGMWIREWKKHQTWKGQNGSLVNVEKSTREISKKLDTVSINVVEVKTEVKAIQANCAVTTSRFDKDISESQRLHIDHLKNHSKK